MGPPVPTAAELAAAQAAAQRKIEIATAKARCVALMARHDIVAIPKDAIEEGECGALAPVELISVGKAPQVALSPPVIVTCDLAVAIHDWMKADVQPLAKKHLGQPIARIETMSSYSCRNAFGRKLGKLSEHGKANAVDIRGFVSAKGDTAYLLEHWGLTGVEIKALAAKAEQEQRERDIAAAKAKAEADAKALAAAKPQPQSGSPNPIAGAGTLIDGLPKPGISIGESGIGIAPAGRATDFGIGPNRLGGPKKQPDPKPAGPVAVAPVQPPLPTAGPDGSKLAQQKSAFLRETHATACKRFMTTLGPEADKFHRNHFHIDLAERRTAKQICD
jgi:hypothetical protein